MFARSFHPSDNDRNNMLSVSFMRTGLGAGRIRSLHSCSRYKFGNLRCPFSLPSRIRSVLLVPLNNSLHEKVIIRHCQQWWLAWPLDRSHGIMLFKARLLTIRLFQNWRHLIDSRGPHLDRRVEECRTADLMRTTDTRCVFSIFEKKSICDSVEMGKEFKWNSWILNQFLFKSVE